MNFLKFPLLLDLGFLCLAPQAYAYSLHYLKNSDGFELGGAPTLVVMNDGGNAGTLSLL